MKNKFVKNIAFVLVLALLAFTSTFAATISPPGKTKSVIVQTQSPPISAVQDSVLNEADNSGNFIFSQKTASADSFAKAQKENAQSTDNQKRTANAVKMRQLVLRE